MMMVLYSQPQTTFFPSVDSIQFFPFECVPRAAQCFIRKFTCLFPSVKSQHSDGVFPSVSRYSHLLIASRISNSAQVVSNTNNDSPGYDYTIPSSTERSKNSPTPSRAISIFQSSAIITACYQRNNVLPTLHLRPSTTHHTPLLRRTCRWFQFFNP